jgi:hypothetical protein
MNKINRCHFCGIESSETTYVETQYGWYWSCNNIPKCIQRSASNQAAKRISEFHKGQACVRIPEITCQENGCNMCELNKV